MKTGHLGSTFQYFTPVLDPRGEALPDAHETWNCAEVYGNHRCPVWTGLLKVMEVSKNKDREVKVYRRRRFLGKVLENASRF